MWQIYHCSTPRKSSIFAFFKSFLTERLLWSSQKSIADFPTTSEEFVLDPYSSSYPDTLFIKKNTFLISQ